MSGRSLAIVCLGFLCTPSISQSIDSLRANALAAAKRTYYQSIKGQSLAHHGIEVAPLPKDTQGSPYLWDDFLSGNITYNGMVYENQPLQYDALNDQLLTEHPFGFFPMQYVRSKVSAFEVEGQQFRWLAPPDAPAGFYQVVYQGTLSLLVRRKKEFRERFIDNRIEKVYNRIDQYFLEKDGALVRITSRKQVWAVVGNTRKSSIKKAWQTGGVVFNQQKEKALLIAASLYE
jgi:hypothetical protein